MCILFQLLQEDIDSDKKRHDLFLELLKQSASLQELSAIGTLLQIWPVLAATELRYMLYVFGLLLASLSL